MNACSVMSTSIIYKEGCLVELCIWHFTGCFDIHVYVEESSAYHFAVVLWIPTANDVLSAGVSTERIQIEILLGST
jgi:hypothetical protein